MQNDFEKLLQEVKIDIEKEFNLINSTMSLELKNDIDLINNITEYILMYSGKRLRSVLIILIVKILLKRYHLKTSFSVQVNRNSRKRS